MSKVDEMFVWPRSRFAVFVKNTCVSVGNLVDKMTNNTKNWFASSADRASFSIFSSLKMATIQFHDDV